MARKPSKSAIFVRDLSARTGLSARQLGYAVDPRRLRPGNRIDVLCGGDEVYAAMLEAIAGAERSVCLETYIVAADATGKRFSAALRERARAGVAVRLIYDAIGSFGIDGDFIDELSRDGVQVLEFHPLEPWKKRFGWSVRDHRKILVVDDRVGFAGGFNISDDYLPAELGGGDWYDIHCRVRGPIVGDLARLFRRVWIREGGSDYRLPGRDPVVAESQLDTSLARVVDNRRTRQRWKIRRAYLHAINRAQASIYIMNAYFLPDRGIRRALRRARQRGVRVRIIVPERSDVTVVGYAGQYMYSALIRHGIEILQWPGAMMHAKAASIDGIWASVGSYNLDNRSLIYNLEVMVEVIDPELARGVDRRFERDADTCIPFTRELWQGRSALDKMAAWFFYQLRRWL